MSGVRNVTEEKRAEHVRDPLAAIFEESDDAIAGNTLDGIVTSWNPAATRLFGYEPAEIIGRSITVIIPPELHQKQLEVLGCLRRGERVEHLETVRVARDGHRIDVSLTASPIRNESGAIIGALNIARDITERKRAENMLRDADRRNEEFLATLAHELRNPLAPIRAAAELLRHAEGLAPEHRAAANILERQARHMTHLIDGLLEISRCNGGRVRLNREPIALAELLRAVLEPYRAAAETARQKVTFSAGDAPLCVEADHSRLKQVFSNILQNALQYTPPGGRIEVTLWKENGEAVVSVRDSGVGIPPETLDRIFELSAQVNPSCERTDRGLVIGLTLAKALTELHGGHIEARSAGVGQGSEFLVRLPMSAARPVDRESAPSERPARSVSRRVLIADDNHDAAVSLSLLLQALGHETRIAHDGLEAVEAAEVFRPDVVLLDIGMPRLDGYEAARRIANRPWAGSTRIVAITGRDQDADRHRAKEAGFHQHLVKPADPDTLEQIIVATE